MKRIGGFVYLVSFCFGFGWPTVGACLLSGVSLWCLVEIALGVNHERKYEYGNNSRCCKVRYKDAGC